MPNLGRENALRLICGVCFHCVVSIEARLRHWLLCVPARMGVGMKSRVPSMSGRGSDPKFVRIESLSRSAAAVDDL